MEVVYSLQSLIKNMNSHMHMVIANFDYTEVTCIILLSKNSRSRTGPEPIIYTQPQEIVGFVQIIGCVQMQHITQFQWLELCVGHLKWAVSLSIFQNSCLWMYVYYLFCRECLGPIIGGALVFKVGFQNMVAVRTVVHVPSFLLMTRLIPKPSSVLGDWEWD